MKLAPLTCLLAAGISLEALLFHPGSAAAQVRDISAATSGENKAEAILTTPADCPPKEPKDPSIWDKSLFFGFNLTDGNNNTLLANAKISAGRDYAGDIWDFALSGRYGEQEPEDESEDRDSEVTQQDVKTNASYKHLFSERWYAGTAVDFAYDKISDIDYRFILKIPVGYFLVREDTFKLAVEAGPGFVFEEVGDVKSEYLAPFVGETLDWKISETAKLFQNAEFIFDVEDSDNYLIRADAGIEAAINSRLSLVLAVENVYDNLPAEGKKKNDVAISTALKIGL